jgi:hypothetical protein
MDDQKHADLGSWAGLQQAFAIVTGSCAAARAQCLKQVRDSKMLDDLGLTWDEFCKDYAGISRRHADSLIQQHAEFGDAYFRLSEIARVSPRTFRQIAASVDGESLEIDGEKIPLTSANAGRIRAAIHALCRRPRPAASASRPPADLIELQIRIDALMADIDKSIRALSPADSRNPHRGLVAYAANKLRALARRLDAQPDPSAA